MVEALAVVFNLREGMSAKDLLFEIRGKIAGENQGQILQFEAQLRETKKSIPTLSIKVDNENQTAIIRVTPTKVDGLGLPEYGVSKNYVMGISDEGKYFAHEIEGVPARVHSMGALVDWMNRVDEGFTQRVQGDMLLQFVPLRQGAPEDEPDEIYLSHRPVLSAFAREKEAAVFGNHRILTPKGTRVGSSFHDGVEYLVLQGQQFIMLHPEHGMKQVRIPFNHAAVVTYQRGRAGQNPVD